MSKRSRIDSRLAVFHVRLVRTRGGYMFFSDPILIGEHDCAYSQGTGASRLSDLPEDEWVRRGARFAKFACPELCGHTLDGV